jgi:hypothetical protein
MPDGSEAPTANERALANAYKEGANAGNEDMVKSYINTAIENDEIDLLNQYMRGSLTNKNVNAVEIFVSLANGDPKILEALKACIEQSFVNKNIPLSNAYIQKVTESGLLEPLLTLLNNATNPKDQEWIRQIIFYTIAQAIKKAPADKQEELVGSYMTKATIGNLIEYKHLKNYIDGAILVDNTAIEAWLNAAEIEAQQNDARDYSYLSNFIRGAVDNQNTKVIIAFIKSATAAGKKDNIIVAHYPRENLDTIRHLNYALLTYWPVNILREVQQETRYFFNCDTLSNLVVEYINGYSGLAQPLALQLITKLVMIGVTANAYTMSHIIDKNATKLFNIMQLHNLKGLLEEHTSTLFYDRDYAHFFITSVYKLFYQNEVMVALKKKCGTDMICLITSFIDSNPLMPDELMPDELPPEDNIYKVKQEVITECKTSVLHHLFPNLGELSIAGPKPIPTLSAVTQKWRSGENYIRSFSITSTTQPSFYNLGRAYNNPYFRLLYSQLQSPENASYLRSLEILYKQTDTALLALAIWQDLKKPDFFKKLKGSKAIRIGGSAYLYRDLFFKTMVAEPWQFKEKDSETTLGKTIDTIHAKTTSGLLKFAIKRNYGKNVLKPLLKEVATDKNISIDDPETLKEYFKLATKLSLNSTEADSVIKGLQTKKFDLNTVFPDKKSALETAVEGEATNVVKALLNNGVNGKATLQLAFLKGNTDVVIALLNKGANIHIAWNRACFLQHLLESDQIDKNAVISTLINKGYDLRVSWGGQSFLKHCEEQHIDSTTLTSINNKIQSANKKDSRIACILLAVAPHLIAKYVFDFNMISKAYNYLSSPSESVVFSIIRGYSMLAIPSLLIIGAGVLYNSPPSMPDIERIHEIAEKCMRTNYKDVLQEPEIE